MIYIHSVLKECSSSYPERFSTENFFFFPLFGGQQLHQSDNRTQRLYMYFCQAETGFRNLKHTNTDQREKRDDTAGSV